MQTASTSGLCIISLHSVRCEISDKADIGTGKREAQNAAASCSPNSCFLITFEATFNICS